MTAQSINLDSYTRFLTQLAALNLKGLNDSKGKHPIKQTVLDLNISRFSDFLNKFTPLFRIYISSGNLINLFALLGPKRDEVKNVALLAWVFDCHASHGQGASFFHAYLDILRDHNPLEDAFDKKHWDSYLVHTELNPFGDNTNRIDMVFKAKNAVIYIEVKVDAGEGFEQLARYKNKLNQENAPHRALVFLTTRQDLEGTSDYYCSHWRDVTASLKPKPNLAEFPKSFFQQLTKHFGGLMRTKKSTKR